MSRGFQENPASRKEAASADTSPAPPPLGQLLASNTGSFFLVQTCVSPLIQPMGPLSPHLLAPRPSLRASHTLGGERTGEVGALGEVGGDLKATILTVPAPERRITSNTHSGVQGPGWKSASLLGAGRGGGDAVVGGIASSWGWGQGRVLRMSSLEEPYRHPLRQLRDRFRSENRKSSGRERG